MPEIRDPALLSQLNGGGQSAPAPPRGPVFGPAPAPEKPAAPPSGFRPDGNGGLTPIPGGPADPGNNAPPAGYTWNQPGNPSAGLTPIPGGPADKPGEGSKDADSARAELLNVIGKAGEARRKSGEWFATGFGADTAGKFGGTNASDVQSLLDTIGGNTAFDRLAKMRAESPTGAALGAVSDTELRLLQSTVASLDKTQSDEQFRKSMDDVIRTYGRMLAKLPGTDANAVLQSMLEGGSTIEEIDALASGMGVTYDRDKVLANIQSRDSGGPINKFVPDPNAPKGGGNGGGGGANMMFEGVPGLEGDYSLSAIGEGLAQGTGDIVQTVGDTVGMFTRPISLLMAETLGYDSRQLPTFGTQLREGVGLPQSPEGIVRTVNQFGTGALTGSTIARGVASIANPGTLQSVAQIIGRTPIRDTVAGVTAGAGSSIGQELGGTAGQIVGTLAGGIGGYAGANAAMRAAAPRAPNALAQAAGRQNVDLLPADTGGPIARAVTTGTKASPLSVSPVVEAAESQQRQFGEAVRRTAAAQGEVVNTQVAGESVRKGAKEYIKEATARGNRLYERAFAQAKGVTAIKPQATVAAAQSELARLKANPAASPGAVAELEGFISNIQSGVSIQGLRDARTLLSQGVYDGKLRGAPEQAMWKNILGNVSSDIEAGLRSAGRDQAADTFRAADKLWAERIEVIDQALAPIIGKDGLKSGEEVLAAVESMTQGKQGGNMRLGRLLSSLPEAEAGKVRATLVDRLGRAKPGAQDAQGETFSPATFLTNWNKMTPQAKVSLYPDKSMRDALNDLAVIAEGTKRGQSMTNTSNTGVAVNSADQIRMGANLAVGGATAVASLPLAIVSGLAVYGTGKLMASPGFARLLARTAKMPPEAANRTFREQLGVLASRDPALQGDVNALLQAVNDNGSRLAAEQNGEQQ